MTARPPKGVSVFLHYPLVLGEAVSGAVSGPTSGLGQGAGKRVNLPMVGQDSETVLMDPVVLTFRWSYATVRQAGLDGE